MMGKSDAPIVLKKWGNAHGGKERTAQGGEQRTEGEITESQDRPNEAVLSNRTSETDTQ